VIEPVLRAVLGREGGGDIGAASGEDVEGVRGREGEGEKVGATAGAVGGGGETEV
jgi:hypothetical protein